VLPGYDGVRGNTVGITKDHCNYVYDTYGRLPATFDPISMRSWLQTHHIELERYDRVQREALLAQRHQ